MAHTLGQGLSFELSFIKKIINKGIIFINKGIIFIPGTLTLSLSLLFELEKNGL